MLRSYRYKSQLEVKAPSVLGTQPPDQFRPALEVLPPMHSRLILNLPSLQSSDNYPSSSFLKIISTTAGGTITNYSPRFSLTGMTGSFPPNVAAGLKNVKGTTAPSTENNVANSGAGAPDPIAPDASYAIPFLSQKGTIMYAPMQGRPGSKITAKTATPAYPTSSVQVATTKLPPPVQITTHTLSMTASTSSHENTVFHLLSNMQR